MTLSNKMNYFVPDHLINCVSGFVKNNSSFSFNGCFINLNTYTYVKDVPKYPNFIIDKIVVSKIEELKELINGNRTNIKITHLMVHGNSLAGYYETYADILDSLEDLVSISAPTINKKYFGRLKNIKRLELSGKIGDHIEILENLEHLKIKDCIFNFSDLDLDLNLDLDKDENNINFKKFTKLKSLSLDLRYYNLFYRPIDLSFLTDLKNLRCLTVENYDLNDLSILGNLDKLNSLSLDIVYSLENISDIKNLRHLIIKNIKDIDLKPLRLCKRLKILELPLDFNRSLVSIGYLTELRKLRIGTYQEIMSHDGLDDDMRTSCICFDRSLEPLKNLKNLNELEFYPNNRYEESFEPLKYLDKLRTVKTYRKYEVAIKNLLGDKIEFHGVEDH